MYDGISKKILFDWNSRLYMHILRGRVRRKPITGSHSLKKTAVRSRVLEFELFLWKNWLSIPNREGEKWFPDIEFSGELCLEAFLTRIRWVRIKAQFRLPTIFWQVLIRMRIDSSWNYIICDIIITRNSKNSPFVIRSGTDPILCIGIIRSSFRWLFIGLWTWIKDT